MEQKFVSILNKNGYTEKNSPIFVQSFEVNNLKALSKMTKVPLLQLLEEPQERPYDFIVNGDPRTYGDLTRPENLKEIATYARAIGPYKRMIVPQSENKNLIPPTTLVSDAHSVGLLVHPYTFRNEAQYLAPTYKGDPITEYIQFFELGIDGLFSDFPDTAIKARDEWRLRKIEIRNQKIQ